MAKATGISVRNIYYRREALEGRLTIQLPSNANPFEYNPRLKLENITGSVVVFSDCHWWPGISETVAYKALLEVIREIKPTMIVANGDILDGARISRFGPIGWEKTPDVKAELDEVQVRMTAIRLAARKAIHVRTIGNHDLRYDSTLASRAREFTGIKGFRLADHLCEWKETMSLWINDNTVIKHRWHNGVNAGYYNTMKSGKSVMTGHDHHLKVTPYQDYNGIRFAGQDGTLADGGGGADPGGPQFAYGEDNPSQANSGFLVLPFIRNGHLIEPEVCRVINGEAWFRNQRVAGRRKVAA
jgi:hypothetical protein